MFKFRMKGSGFGFSVLVGFHVQTAYLDPKTSQSINSRNKALNYAV